MPTSTSSLEATLTRAWLRRGPLACALWPLSLLFGALSAARRALYRAGLLASARLPVPVVVVGNIYIGGTGKTPLTIWLVEALRAAGFRPGVISRGHGGAAGHAEGNQADQAGRVEGAQADQAGRAAGAQAGQAGRVDGAQAEQAGRADGAQPGAAAPGARAVTAASSPREVGDEPVLIARRAQCPVFVGRDRAAAGRALLAAHPQVDVLVTDDGLQHYALQRDVEIVLFDGRGAGNGWLLPAGPLRESVSRRRDFTVVNAAAIEPELAAAVGGQPFRMLLAGEFAERLMQPAERVALPALKGKRIVAAAGIGNPGRFFALLRAAGLEFAELPLADHHDFLDDPFAHVDADLILITEKDAVKCGQIENLKNDPRLWVVPVTAQLDAALAEQIVEKCRGCSTA